MKPIILDNAYRLTFPVFPEFLHEIPRCTCSCTCGWSIEQGPCSMDGGCSHWLTTKQQRALYIALRVHHTK